MGVSAIPLSIDLWTAYLDATLEIVHGQDDYELRMRNLYEKALEKAGLEFRSDALWEHYISWESGHNRLGRVLAIYDRLLHTPTQLYFQNWDSFKKLIEENRPEDFLPLGEFAELLARVSPVAGTAMRIALSDPSAASVPIPEITEADRNSIRKLVIDRREKVYQATYLQIMKRWYFEEKIRRPYFHVKPLEEAQLSNWAEYLSFEESEAASAEALLAAPVTEDAPPQVTMEDVQQAKKRVRILYERCLVACALYEHMWIRYAKYLEYTEQDFCAARDVWRRACTVHLRSKPTIHWHWALFEVRHPAVLDNSEPKSPLEILSSLEERLPDSALTCARHVDAMRRAGKPLLDLIVCLRSGINRLRLRATEQASIAHNASGPTGSLSAAIALATSVQARAGASYLAGKMARLLHRNVDGMIPASGIPTWQLLLNSAYKPTPVASVKEEGREHGDQPNPQFVEDEKNEVFCESQSSPGNEKELDASKALKAEEMDVEHEKNDDILEEEQAEVVPESIIVADESKEDKDMDIGADSPPVVIVRKKTGSTNSNAIEVPVKPTESDKATENNNKVEEDEEPGPPAPKRKRRSRWGDVEGETDTDLMKMRAAEEERLARADREQKAYAVERAAITNVAPPEDPSTLHATEHVLLSPEQAAITVLKEAIEFDPRNERLYSQLLDIAYQRRPLDETGFLEFADLAIVDSILPATVKLAFSQRKLQFLEEFCNDVNKISAAFDEYIQLAQLVVQCTTADKKVGLAGGVDAPQAYNTPDLLNVVLPVPLRPSAHRNPVPNGPVRRIPQVDISAAILEDASSVGTPVPQPETAASLFTAGAYEPFAGPSAGGLPPPAPTMVPVAAAGLAGPDSVELWRGMDPTAYAAAVSSTYASGGGTFYAPLNAGADAASSVQAPPPALMSKESA
uniref:Suf domain-containing protein n=1 Tax=Mesocestoides corti TaxID=53468 RepID=A0A5K3FTJ4_MESCO